MNRTRTTALIAGLAGLTSAAHAQTAYVWAAPVSGFWDDAANWTPNTDFPDLDGDTATIGLSGAFTADLDRTVDITTLDITNPDAGVEIRGGNRLQVYDRVTNNGTIFVNSNASVFNSFLEFLLSTTSPVAGHTLEGTGSVVLGAVSDFGDARVAAADGVTLTHAATHTIEGAGQIDGDILNLGLITANTPASIGLRIQDTITQTGFGTITADGADVLLNTATIDGGTITTLNGGALSVSASPSVLTGNPSVSGTINIPGGNFVLELASDITVNGDINLNSSSQVFNAILRFTQTAALTGAANINLQLASTDTADSRIDTLDGFVASLGPDVNVSGAGRMTGSFNVAGSIDANSETELLEIFDHVTLVGSGVIRATGGQLGLNSATITNPRFESTAPGRVRSSVGASLLDGAGSNAGTLAVMGSGHTIEINNTFTNNGVIQLNPDLTVFNSTLLLSGAPVINGVGQIQLFMASTDTNDAKLESADGVTAVLGAGQTIFGEGRIVGDFMSNAHIEATSPTNPLELRGSIVQASGVVAANNAVFALVNGSITGGTLSTANNGVVTAASGADNAVTDLTNNGDLGIDGSGATLTASGVITNNGRILINRNDQVFNATLALADGAGVTGTGEINLHLASTDVGDARIDVPAGTASIGPNQTITGQGRIVGNLNILGTIAPGASAGSIECLNAVITRGPSSVFEVELSAADGFSHDRLTGNADHVLDGALVVSEIDAYIPVVGDEFTLIQGASVTGKFTSETMPATLPNRVYRVFYEADRVLLVYTCTGDFAPPYDVLDFSDVIAFLTAFSSGDPIGDLAPPLGVFDFSDVIAFLTAFGSGCS